MGKETFRRLRVMGGRKKTMLVLAFFAGMFMFTGLLMPLLSDSASKMYYFTLDSTSQALGPDGSTDTRSLLGGKISMTPGAYNSVRYVSAATNTNWQTMMNVYGPAYSTSQTLTSPAITIGTRDNHGTSNPIYWKADVYDYDPSPTAAPGNGVLLWSTTGTDESHSYTTEPKALTFGSQAAKNIPANHRLKVVISCRMTSTNSDARFYWGNDGNYSFMTVSEAATAANTVTVTNLGDYNDGALTSVLDGEQNIAMLEFDLYANAAGSWLGGKLDKIGSNPNLNDVTYSIYKDSNSNGRFDPGSDSLIGGPYNFSQNTGSTYTLASPQSLTAVPQRFFIAYNIVANAATATTVGMQITDSTYFTVSNGLATSNVTRTPSSLPIINGNGIPVTKTYAADWDSGTSLIRPELGGPTVTNSVCVSSPTNPAEAPGTDLVGLLNFPAHSCASANGSMHVSSEANAKFVTLYFNAPAGYSTNLAQVKGISFKLSARYSGTITLFYVKPDGTRVNSPVSTNYASNNNSTNGNIINVSLAGQTFANVPAGSRMGVQIGVSRAGAGIGLGGAIGAQLVLEETSAAASGVDVGDGAIVTGGTVLAASTGNVVNSFTLTSPTRTQTVSSVTITGNATTNSTNVAAVKLYADLGTTGILDPADLLLGTGTFSGNSATISGFSETVSGTTKRYLVVYDIAAATQTNIALTGFLTSLGAVTIDSNADISSGTLTIVPTTTVTNGTSEPANMVTPSGGAAVNLDAFGLNINGGSNDQISSVTISLAPAAISSKVAMLEIVDRSTGAVYGQLTAPTIGDDWRVSTSGLFATPATTQCYVRLTPKANITTTYSVTGTVSAITHFRYKNGLVVGDIASATVILDGQAPSDPVLTASSGSGGGQIQLSWTPASDSSGLNATRAYTLVRGAVNAPAPSSCSSGTVIYQGSNLNASESNLSPGQTYAYRVCATDVVNNTGKGSKASAVATIPLACNNAPTIFVNPSSHYVLTGNKVQYNVSLTNNDTGACGTTVFTLSLVGTENTADFVTPSTFSSSTLSLGPNGGGATSLVTVTARANATQGATNSFAVRASANNHPSATSVTINTTINDTAPMLHTSLNLGTQKYGTWGTDYNCSTCHNKRTTNIKRVGQNVKTPLGNRAVVFSRTSSSVSTTSGVFGNDRRSGSSSQNVCEVCHHQTRFHQYSTGKVSWIDHNNSTDCMKCHPHEGGFKYVGGGQCDDCHGNPPTSLNNMAFPPTNALGMFAPNAGAHAKHQEHMVCATCHSNANHSLSPTPHENNLIEMGFTINGANFPGFNASIGSGTLFTATNNLNNGYQWAAAPGTTLLKVSEFTTTCSVYCHGWTGSGGSNPTPSWVGASQKSCGTCHDATGDTPPLSGSHLKHAGTGIGSNGIACAKCHSTYSNYSTSIAHINGKVEWNLSQISPSALYNGSNSGTTGAPAPTSSAGYGTCTNLYCHSNVQSANGTAGPSYYAAPRWGDVTLCGSCHQDMAVSTSATGGHKQHTQDPVTQFECRICHGTGGDANPQNHANSRIDFSFSGIGANTTYSKGAFKTPGNGGYGTCSNSDCHGRRTLGWGPSTALPLCDKCHGSATTAAFYDTRGPGSPTARTETYVGSHDQHIKAAPYVYANGMDCGECHIKPAGPYSPGHMDNALPAEVEFGPIASSGVYVGYTTMAGYAPANRQCSNVWCHGAGMDSNTGKGAYASVLANGGSLGTPVVPKWNDVLLNGSAGNDCSRCHGYPPSAPNSGFVHYGKTPADCNGCHNNVKLDGSGFIDASLHVNGTVDGCFTCHGRPPVDSASLVKPALKAMSPGNSGAHNAHQLNPNIDGSCAVCHNNYTSQMPSYTMEMGFNAYGGKVTSGTFYGYSSIVNNTYVSSSAGTTVYRTNNTALQNKCTNVYCHGGGTTTKPMLVGGSNVEPNWELGYEEVNCGSCHGVTAATFAVSGSHARHAGSGSGGLAVACDKCHGLKINNYHVNGSVEWDLNTTDILFGATATYKNVSSGATGNLAPSSSFGACNGIYCHSTVQGANGSGLPTYKTTPLWNDTTALSCGQCHTDMTASGTGNHLKHPFTCSVCHSGAGDGSVKHADHYIDVSFSGAGSGGAYTQARTPAGSDGYGACSNLYCHSNAQGTGGNGAPTSYTAPTWGTAGPLGCGACHADMTTAGTGNHLKHTAAYVCTTCHSGAGSGTAKHGDQYIDVAFSGVGAGTSYSQPRSAAGSDGYGTCSNIACHYNGSANWGGGTLACVSCHPLATLQASGAHGKHLSTAPTFYAYTANRSTAGAYDYGCSNCHPLDKAAKHANGAIDVTLNNTNSGAGGAVGSLRSRNNATADGLAANNGPSGIFGTTKVSVRCSAAYCHSNGYATNLKFMTTPDWYGPAYTGDKCAMCHGNSPNANDPVNQPGSPAHYNKNFLGFANVSGGHGRGIHMKNIFTGIIGSAAAGNTATSSHGNSLTSTTINCNMCHYKTITTSANDKNRSCAGCHASVPKNPAELIADKRSHVNGAVDVDLRPIRVKSKAQLRDGSVDTGIWSRQVGYKVNGAYDVAFKTFTTSVQWNSATKTCSNIVCHNGKTVKWGDTGGITRCESCHDR
ncbi:CxxxxCH/CxxCH domain-containing protein [Geotalea sp. SG265]|uniref:CxxxxCH/CxxCH domain c-type cytochrome n=1 Tax=Geotalea sp. SG265 TaxID=2922867 RepID=UPI001FAF0A0F|nr:CxxxxCH/CxxCH domain-containing protein [Geotalea sp. SG265]